MNIGFVGYGEAAFNISFGLAGEGVQGIRAHDAMMHHEVMGRQVHTRAEKAGVTLVESAKEVVDWADVVIVVVPPACAMDVCLPIVERSCNAETVPYSLTTGMASCLFSALLVPLFIGV